jgi:mycoredoxin-dependent peroxiredoxin
MAVEVGSEAPDFTVRDENGEELKLSSLRGRNVVLVFYPLAFSPLCTRELHDISGAAERYDAAGAEVIGISVDSPYALKAFKRDEDIKARLASDFHPKGAVARQYGAYIEDAGIATRATFVIDKDGMVAYKVITNPGQGRDQEEYLEALASCPV